MYICLGTKLTHFFTLSFIKCRSWSPGNPNVYFTVFEADEATAVDMANNVFLSNSGSTPIPIEVVAVTDSPPPVLHRPWCRIPGGCHSGNLATCMKPCDDIDTPDGLLWKINSLSWSRPLLLCDLWRFDLLRTQPLSFHAIVWV